MWKIPLACLLIFLHTPNPLSDVSLILWNLGVGKFQVVTRCFSHPGMARVFFFLIRIFFLMSNWLLLLPPALPLLLLRLHRLLHLLEAGKIFLNFQIFKKQHFVSRTYFYSSPRRRRLWPRRPHQGAHSVRAAPAEGGRETVCNIAKIIRKTWYCPKKVFASTMWKNL